MKKRRTRKAKPKVDIDARTFEDFLMQQVPSFDREILKDWNPDDDAWVGTATMIWDMEQWLEDRYNETLRAVRRIVEGSYFEDWPSPIFPDKPHVYDMIHVGAPDLPLWDAVRTQLLCDINNLPNDNTNENPS